MIEMPISEIIDKFTIMKLKIERLPKNHINTTFKKEYSLYEKEIVKKYKKYVDNLYEINGKIWDLEADIRKGKEDDLGLEEVGKRALLIRELNKQRIRIKNIIVKHTGKGFIDIKINHASMK